MHALVWISLIMPQFARPSSDRSNAPPPDNWVAFGAPSLFQAIDDPISGHDGDVTYAEALEPQDHVFSVNLQSLADPEQHTGHIVQFWARRVDPIAGDTLTITLRQGVTTIAIRTFPSLSAPYLLNQVLLTTAKAAAITNYGDLNVEMKALSSNSLGAIRITQIYLEVPSPPSSSSVTAVANAAAASRRIRLGASTANAVATPAANCVRVRTGGASPSLAIATASQPMPMLILRDRAHGAARSATGRGCVRSRGVPSHPGR